MKQLSKLKFCRVMKGEKRPFESDWNNKPYTYEEIQKYIPQENYGVLCGYEGLLIIDADTEELTEGVLNDLPNTFRVQTGSGGIHHYYICPELKKKIVLTKDGVHYGEIQSWGSQCVGPNSLHPNGKKYEPMNDEEITTLTKEQILEFAKKYTNQIDFNSEKQDFKEEWIEEFIEEIIPKWKEGDRQELALSTAGYLRKNKRLGANSVKAIISEICDRTEDKEKEMRLRAVIETFKKDEGDVKGSSGLKEKGIEENPLNQFIWDEDKLIQKKSFPIDLHKDLFYYGLLIPREVPVEDKMGNVLGKKQKLFKTLITKNGKPNLIQFSNDVKEKMAIDFHSLPEYLPQRWKLNKIKEFLDGKTEEVKGLDLLNKIKKQYEKYLYIRNKTWYSINAIWDLGTYLYPLFEAYPLFEKRGIAGTGKSKEMTISSYMTFNGGQIMVNPSESTLFRETEEVRGTKYFDEAEKLWVFNKYTKQFEGDVRTELINASYTKEAKVPRQEKIGNKFVTKWYSPYSPTQLSSINGLYGATETRCITRITTKSPNDDNRGEKEPSEDRNNAIWEEIRDECYRFALENWKEIKQVYNELKDTELKRRDFQIWKPLLAIAKYLDEGLYKEIISFAVEITKRRTDDLIPESSFDYMCLKALKETIESSISDKVYVNAIKLNYCNLKNDNEGLTDIYLNRNISNHLDKLGFKEFRDKDRNGSLYFVDINIFNEIVSPICQELVILSSHSSHSSHLHINEQKNSDDSMTISDDKKKENVTIVTIGDENDDGKENKGDKKLEDFK